MHPLTALIETKSAGAYSIISVYNGLNAYHLFSFFCLFFENPPCIVFFLVILRASKETKTTEKKTMQQLQNPSRPSEFPADTLRYLRRLVNLTARYCDRIEAEKDFNIREKNHIYAMRCIFRIQKALWDNAGEIKDKEERERLSKISDALLDVWDLLSDRRVFSVCAYVGIIAGLSIKCVDNYDLYKTSFDCILSQIKQYTK